MMSIQAQAAERFRDQHRVGRLLLPNAWDAVSARVFEESGFEAIGTTSAGIAYTEGFRDAEEIGRDAMIRGIAKIVGAVRCPVNADIEAGYGVHPSDVAATVNAVMDVGVAGINLEDNTHNTHGHGDGRLFDIDAQCARIAAARDAAVGRGIPLVINARTDTFLTKFGNDVDGRILETAKRGTQYLQAGADVIFVPMLIDPSLVQRLADRLRGPISLMGMPGAPAAKDLFAAGAVRVSIGQTALLAALGCLKNIAEELRQDGTWGSIERTFFGFAETEALFAPRRRTLPSESSAAVE